MEDLPTSLLLQQKNAKPRSGEELETLGKYAASLYLGGQCKTLTDSVVESVKRAGLAPEQVQRVVEFANTDAYLRKFASAGPNHKVVHFDGGPASLPEVLKDLNDGGGGSVPEVGSSDYSLPPPDTAKLAMRNMERMGLEDEKIASAFGVEEVYIPYEEPLRDAIDMRDKLASLYDEASSEISGLETVYMDVCDHLFKQVKQASLNGTPLGHVVAAWTAVTENPDFFKAAFEEITPRLLENEVFRSGEALGDSLMKTAGIGMVNPDHPLLEAFSDFCETLNKLAGLRQVQSDVIDQLDVVSTFLKKADAAAEAAGEAGESVIGQIPKAWRVVRDAAAKASVPVAEHASKVLGATGGKLVGGAVKYAPHLAVGLAGEEAYQRLNNSPMVQGPKQFVLSRIPYTGANLQRKYQMQMGM